MSDLHPLHVRLTTDELSAVHDKAKEAGHETTAAYVRALLGLPVLWRGRSKKAKSARTKRLRGATA